MCVAVPVRLPHEGATREHWDRHRREHWDRHRSPFLRPYGGTVPVPMFTTNLRLAICHSLCRRTNLRLAICHSLCRRTNLRLAICHSLCRRTNLRPAICHSLCRRTNLRLTICHSLCRRTNRKHWDRHRSPFQRPYGGNDACPYVHGTVLVPMFTLSRCSRNGASLFTVRC